MGIIFPMQYNFYVQRHLHVSIHRSIVSDKNIHKTTTLNKSNHLTIKLLENGQRRGQSYVCKSHDQREAEATYYQHLLLGI